MTVTRQNGPDVKRTFDKPLSLQSLVDTVVERLEEAILSGELVGGTKLLELPLAESLGVSRSVVREAIRSLEGRKLVRRKPFIGAHVASLSPRDLNEIMLVREYLEGLACRLAAEAMTNEEIRALKEAIDHHHGAISLKKGVAHYLEERDYDFHYRIAVGSRNQRLLNMLCDDLYYLLKIYRYRTGSKPERSEQVLEEHAAIAAAISARDPDLAEVQMRRHIQHARTNMLSHIQLQDVEQQAPQATVTARRRRIAP